MKGALLLISALLAAAASAQDDGPFVRTRLEFPGSIQDRMLRDVDGDGLLDVLVVHGAPGDPLDHQLATCRQSPAKAFAACTSFDLPEAARALDVGSIDATPAAELILATDRGVLVGAFTAEGVGPLRTLTDRPTVWTGTDADVPRPADLLFDLDGDGVKEVVLPTLAGPLLLRPGREPQTLQSPAIVSFRQGGRDADVNSLRRTGYQRRVTTEHRTPDLLVEDYDGDGRLDLVTLADNGFRVFPQSPDGSFPSAPARELTRSLMDDDELSSDFTGEASSLAQLDADGRADLVITKWGSSEERTRMDRGIYYSRPDGSFSETPDQSIRSESVFPDFDVLDLNGDGLRDLVIPFFHLAPAQAVRVMTQNAIKLQFRLFLMRPDGRFAQGEGKSFARVDRRVVLTYHLDILKLLFGDAARPTGRIGPLLDFGADFNGDGFADLAADDGSDQLRIFFGNEQARYASSPDLVVPFESTLSYELVDADGDGRTDLFAFHGTRPVREELARGVHAVKRRRAQKERARRAEASRAREADAEEEPPERVRLEILMAR